MRHKVIFRKEILMNRARACEILGVRLDSTHEEIRKAYKRRALETHPDKIPGGDNEAFKEVATAYAVLSGQTDHMTDLKATMAHIFTPDFIAQVLKSVITVMESRREAAAAAASTYVNTKPKTIHLDLEVTIEDLYRARVKKLSVKVLRFNKFSQQLEESVHTIYICLKNYQLRYKFKGVGDEAFGGEQRSSNMVHLQIMKDPRVRLDNLLGTYDLYIDHCVSLKDYYLAKTIQLLLWDDVEIDVPYERGQKCAMIADAGLPFTEQDVEKRGTLYVFFDLKLPEQPPPTDVLEMFF